MTIIGAIDGVYVNCVLYYKIKAEEAEKAIYLSASGFATFNYTLTNNDAFNIVSVEGEIHI